MDDSAGMPAPAARFFWKSFAAGVIPPAGLFYNSSHALFFARWLSIALGSICSDASLCVALSDILRSDVVVSTGYHLCAAQQEDRRQAAGRLRVAVGPHACRDLL